MRRWLKCHFWSVAKVALRFWRTKQSKNLKKYLVNKVHYILGAYHVNIWEINTAILPYLNCLLVILKPKEFDMFTKAFKGTLVQYTDLVIIHVQSCQFMNWFEGFWRKLSKLISSQGKRSQVCWKSGIYILEKIRNFSKTKMEKLCQS